MNMNEILLEQLGHRGYETTHDMKTLLLKRILVSRVLDEYLEKCSRNP
jgi:hypothetical protein